MLGTRGACTRRSLLRASLAGGAGMALAGCGSSLARLTQAARRPVVLSWRPWIPTSGGSTSRVLLQEGIRPWLARNPGVEVHLVELGDTTDVVASLEAGMGPDVFEDSVLSPYTAAEQVQDLMPWVRRDGVSLNAFAGGRPRLGPLQGPGVDGRQALYGLPAHTRTVSMAVNLGVLDASGLGRPDPSWTYQDWANLWQQVVAANPGRWGGSLDWSGYDGSGGNPAPFYLRGFGGEYVDPANRTLCWLDQSGSLAALSWCYGLQLGNICGGSTDQDFGTGRLVSGPLGTTGGLLLAAQQWRDLHWGVYPMPRWPQGRFTLGSGQFCAMWAGTGAPDVAWSLMHYLCVQQDWQRYLIVMALLGPNQSNLWSEWKARVLSTAPPLQSVDLQVFVDAVQREELYPGLSFQFAEEQSTEILETFGSQVQSGMSVQAAALAATRQIDAVQSAAALQEQAARAAAARLTHMAANGAGPGPAG